MTMARNMMQLQEQQDLFSQATSTGQGWILRPLRGQPGIAPHPLVSRECLIGSGSGCDFKIDAAGVGERHCLLVNEGEKLLLIAEDTRTWINDGAVSKTRIKSGDRLTIGPVTLLVETLPGTSRPASVPRDVSHPDDLLAESQLLRYLRRAIERNPETEHLAELNSRFHPPRNPATTETLDDILNELQSSIQTTQRQVNLQQQELRRLESERQLDAQVFSPAGADFPVPVPRAVTAGQGGSVDAALSSSELARFRTEWQLRWEQVQRQRQRARKLRQLRRLRHQRDVRKLQNVIHEQQRTLALREQELASRERKLVEVQQELSSRQASFEREATTLANQIAGLQSALEQTRVGEQETDLRLAELEQRLAAHAEQEQRLSLLNAERENLVARLTEQERSLSDLEQRATEQVQQLAEAKQACQSYEQRFQEQREQLASQEQEIQFLQSREQEWQTLLAGQADELDRLGQQSRNARERVESLQGEKEELTAQIKQLREELQAATAMVESTKEAAGLTDPSELDNAWEQLSEERDRVYRLRQELEEQREAFTQARTDINEVRAEAERELYNLREQQEELTAERLRLDLLRESLQQQPDAIEPSETSDSPAHLENQEPLTWSERQHESEEYITEAMHPGLLENPDGTPGIREALVGGIDVPELPDCDEESIAVLPNLEAPQAEAREEDGSATSIDSAGEEIDYPGEDSATDDGVGGLDDSMRDFEFAGLFKDVSAIEHAVPGDAVDVALNDSSGEQDGESDEELHKLRQELAAMFGMGNMVPHGSQASEEESACEEQTGQVEEAPVENSAAEAETREEDYGHSEQDAPLATEFEELVESRQPETVAGGSPVQGDVAGQGDVVVEDIEDAESVAAYMERLFARTSGNQTYVEPSLPSPAVQPAISAQTGPVLSSLPGVPNLMADPHSAGSPEISADCSRIRVAAPIDRDSMKREIESLRDVANQTARNALATHAWKQVKLKMWASGLLTLISAGTAGALICSPYWSPVSYENYGWLTLLLALVSGGELFRSRLALMRLKQSGKPATTSGERAIAAPTVADVPSAK
ncbi:MAG: FHA domain-containing protein [Planctomycetaceae bacterium]|nr:FHA domain-containing protein [Planctomycetaceae bacterium]